MMNNKYPKITKKYLVKNYINNRDMSQHRLAEKLKEEEYKEASLTQLRSAILRRLIKYALKKEYMGEIIWHRDKVNISKEMNQIILGSLLGDMSIKSIGSSTATITEVHGFKQKEYLIWKCNKLKDLGTKWYKGIQGTYEYYGMYSKCLSCLREYLFKEDDLMKKVLERLEDKGLTMWYLDDGTYSYRTNTLSIAMVKLSPKVVGEVIKWITQKYRVTPQKVEVKRKGGGKGYILRFNVEHTQRLLKFMRHHIPSCMAYKKGMDKEKRESARNKRLEYQREYNKTEKHKIYHRKYYREYYRRKYSKNTKFHP